MNWSIDLLEQVVKKPQSPININNMLQNLKHIIRRGDNKLASYLIKEAMTTSSFGYSKLHYEALVEQGEPSRVLTISVLKKNMMDGITPLHVACINPNVTPLKKLLSVNPAYDVPDAEGYRPAHYAAACVEDGPLKYLVSKRSVNLNAGIENMLTLDIGNNRRITPLMVACLNGREHNVDLLLDECKRLTEEMKEANEEKQKEKAKGKKKKGEDAEMPDEMELATDKKATDFVNSQSQQKVTAAHFAAENGHLEILKKLVDAGAVLEVVSSKGWTPLMGAAACGHMDCVKYLIETAKVNPLTKNKKAKNALTYAVVNGHLHIVSYLLRLGVHPEW